MTRMKIDIVPCPDCGAKANEPCDSVLRCPLRVTHAKIAFRQMKAKRKWNPVENDWSRSLFRSWPRPGVAYK